jgi:hypothetical protein
LERTYGMQNSGNKYKKIFNGSFKEKSSGVFHFFIALAITFLCLQLPATAQIHDIGIGLGAANYTGELSRSYKLLTHRPAGWAFYRYNLNNNISFRGSASLGRLTASDDPAFDPFAARRSPSEFRVNITELAATFEYNFFDFKDPKSLVRWSPYFFGGIGLFLANGFKSHEKPTDYHKIQPSIPVGIGFKYRLSPYLTLGYEWGARKTFFDYIENVGEYLPENGVPKNYQYGNIHHKDWYYFTGFTLSYTIWTIPCPYLFE